MEREWSNAIKDINYAFTWDEILKILDTAKQENYRDYVLLTTLAFTGRRVGEIVSVKEKDRVPSPGLKVCDIDFTNQTICFTILKQFKKIKSKDSDYIIKERKKLILPANTKLLELLQEYIRTNNLKDEDLLFDITRQRVWQIVKKYCEKCGIEKKRIVHAFRHGFAIKAIQEAERPEDILSIKKLLAHSNILTTQSYLVFAKTKEKEILEKFI